MQSRMITTRFQVQSCSTVTWKKHASFLVSSLTSSSLNSDIAHYSYQSVSQTLSTTKCFLKTRKWANFVFLFLHNCMSSLFFSLSFLYTANEKFLPQNSVLQFRFITSHFQVHRQRPSIYFPFLTTAKASKQEVTSASDSLASTFLEPQWRCRYLEKNVSI